MDRSQAPQNPRVLKKLPELQLQVQIVKGFLLEGRCTKRPSLIQFTRQHLSHVRLGKVTT